MKISRTILLPLLIAIFTVLISAQEVVNQPSDNIEKPPKSTILFDDFGDLTECSFSARMDQFLIELMNDPSTHGYIINYRATDILPSEYERGTKRFREYLVYRKFDVSRITFLEGFRETLITQLWIVPPGGEIPKLTDTVTAPKLPKNKTYLFFKGYVEDYENLYKLDSYIAEWKKSLELQEETDGAEASETAAEASGPESPAENEDLYWINYDFAKKVQEQKKSRGVIVFYLDDETDDANKVHDLMRKVAVKLAESVELPADRFEIKFGGYGDAIKFHMWVVPQNGQAPEIKPDERLPKEPDTVDN
jgi:hypothetical protein